MNRLSRNDIEIGLGAGITDSAADFACGNIERGDKGFGSVPDILELAPLDMSRLHRQARGGTFQRLDAGHFVARNSLHVLLGGGGGGPDAPRRYRRTWCRSQDRAWALASNG